MRLKNKSGFTLLEIIIVIIIIGVLASLALPRLFATVEYSRSAEALATIATIRSSLERCYIQKDASYSACASATNDLSNLDIDNPSSAPNSHFTYQLYAPAANSYFIRAVRNTNESNLTGTNNIGISLNGGATPATLTRCGSGAYKQLGNSTACNATSIF